MAETLDDPDKIAEIRTVVQSIEVRLNENKQDEEDFKSVNQNLGYLTSAIEEVIKLRPEVIPVDIKDLFDSTCDQVHKSLCDVGITVKKCFPCMSFCIGTMRMSCCVRRRLSLVATRIKEATAQLVHLAAVLAYSLSVLNIGPRASTPALSDILKLEFDSKGSEGEFATPEGELKHKILSSDSPETITAAVGDESSAFFDDNAAGSGKTIALIGLVGDREIRNRFHDGIQYISLGKEATVGTVIQEIARVMRRSGEVDIAKKVENAGSLPDAVENASSWFQRRSCLLLIDDMWPTDAFPTSYLAEFRKLLRESTDSRIAISTQSVAVGKKSGNPVVFKAQKPQGDVSVSIFMKYATCCMTALPSTPAVDKVLTLCKGLPIALSAAGSAVAFLVKNGNDLEQACETYMKSCKRSYDMLLSQFIWISLDYLEDAFSNRIAILKVDTEHKIHYLYSSLCVLKNQDWIPISVLTRMWGLEQDLAWDVIEGFCELRLAALSYRRIGDGTEPKAGITLHAFHLLFCKEQARLKKLEALWHSKLLAGVWNWRRGFQNLDLCPLSSQTFLNVDGPPNWEISENDYTCSNLARHLVLSGREAELAALLLEENWVIQRGEKSGIFGLKSDFRILDKQLEIASRKRDRAKSTRKSFQLVLKAIQDSWGSFSLGPRKFKAEMYLRLVHVVKNDEVIDAVVQKFRVQTVILRSSFPPFELHRAKIWEVPADDRCRCVTFSLCGRYVAAGASHDIVIADAVTGDVLKRLKGHRDFVRCIRFVGASKEIVAVSDDLSVAVWRWDQSDAPMFLEEHGSWVTSVDVSSDGKLIVSGSLDGAVGLWHGLNRGEPRFLEQKSAVLCVALCSEYVRVAIGLQNGTLRVLNSCTGELIFENVEIHVVAVTAVAFSSRDERMATCSWDGTIRIWDTEMWEPIGSPATGHTSFVTSVAFCPDGKQLVSSSSDDTVRLWTVRLGASVRESSECPTLSEKNVFSSRAVTCVTFSCDGRRIASGSEDGFACIWDAECMYFGKQWQLLMLAT